ncbi:MAG: acriflavine resistance protein B [Candidatus Riflebacteria bacterium HGW-Riflebacteria-2]|jgi:Cu(I)/Ag(I) efflux system membrane protein CusA/SilA|nr:MAG: acriflavine resistance protein B [Candidatus Riflebacteria bacterium HGW-Riflebacteria-2]
MWQHQKSLAQREPVMDTIIRFFLEKRIIAAILLIVLVIYGLSVIPFDLNTGIMREPVAVDAIPDIGENQQIVFVAWPGRSPKDVDNQITYPLTVSLMGIPGVSTIRANSMFGFSSIYIIFDEKIDFYWSRSRILEKLASIRGSLPEGVTPALGPDATALGQVFWYTVEGKGFDLHELRSVQDWNIKFALQAVEGVAEVGSVGGMVREYQIDIDPETLRVYNITIPELVKTIKESNLDVGAGTIEINRAEYVIRGIGFIKSLDDLKSSVIKSVNGVGITIGNIARVTSGPATRRGALDKEGAEVVGGVVVTRFGANPLEVIGKVKHKISEIAPGLPERTLADGSLSRVKIVPFYDRSKLIGETLQTLQDALSQQITITILVVIVMLLHLSSSLLISGLLPLAVLMTFIAMKIFDVGANLMSLAGIAIAIGTMVDMGIILCENILSHLEKDANTDIPAKVSIFNAASEVGSAVITAVSTTVVSFLPVFVMTGAEGKLFSPLAWTKTFALISSLFIALVLIPVAATLIFKKKSNNRDLRFVAMLISGVLLAFFQATAGIILIFAGLTGMFHNRIPDKIRNFANKWSPVIFASAAALYLTHIWMPLGYGYGYIMNLVAVVITAGSVLGFFRLFLVYYGRMLAWFLDHKGAFAVIPFLVVLFGLNVWLGFARINSWVPAIFSKTGLSAELITDSWVWRNGIGLFPGLGREFMPPLDEGSFLLMPTTMPHASVAECIDVIRKQDMAIRSIPEVESVVGKIGRVDSPLDPAPISMIETVISYHAEYSEPDPESGLRKRQWRDHIKSADDIWKEILHASAVPGTTSAPKLQPIAARLVMLQTGIRAPMGIQITGPDTESVEKLGFALEKELKQVKFIDASTVSADRIVGKPYIEIEIDREAAARYGIKVNDLQNVIEISLGGKQLSQTFEGRERYGIRLRFARELRDNPELIKNIPVATPDKKFIPLGDLTTISFVKGPQVLKSENTFPVGYVIFDKMPEYAETDVVEAADAYLQGRIAEGALKLPANSSFKFIGNYQNQVRSEKKLMVVLPLSLLIIFLILYLEFASVSVTFLVFTGIGVAWAGGFIMIWLYSQAWFLNFSLFGIHFRELLNMHSMNLSIAVWVGFIALFGIASDDGVVMASYLDSSFNKNEPDNVKQIREAVLEAGERRIRPCLMTTATTILALLPVLTSSGRGADVMIPMAVPTFGGMCIELLTLFVVPVGYCWFRELQLKFKSRSNAPEPSLPQQ